MTGPACCLHLHPLCRLNYVIQGPEKRWGPVTGFDLLSKTGGCPARPILPGAAQRAAEQGAARGQGSPELAKRHAF